MGTKIIQGKIRIPSPTDNTHYTDIYSNNDGTLYVNDEEYMPSLRIGSDTQAQIDLETETLSIYFYSHLQGKSIMLYADVTNENLYVSGASILPNTNNTYDLGSTTRIWETTYTTSISDGTNTVAVADILTDANLPKIKRFI